jgi:hypothetical protein
MNAHSGANTKAAAPAAYQAELLRGQVCDDLNRRFWRARQRLLRAFDDRKQSVAQDYDKLTAEAFLAKYGDWRFL